MKNMDRLVDRLTLSVWALILVVGVADIGLLVNYHVIALVPLETPAVLTIGWFTLLALGIVGGFSIVIRARPLLLRDSVFPKLLAGSIVLIAAVVVLVVAAKILPNIKQLLFPLPADAQTAVGKTFGGLGLEYEIADWERGTPHQSALLGLPNQVYCVLINPKTPSVSGQSSQPVNGLFLHYWEVREDGLLWTAIPTDSNGFLLDSCHIGQPTVTPGQAGQ